MKSLFDTNAYNEMTERIEVLTPQSPRLWGQINVGQMIAHCVAVFKVPLSKEKLPRLFIGRLLG